ncbi:MAG TPA: cytochrome c-type biogenesis protein CcmH [Thermoleophilaceae bacterium]|nr:cytochrome c-type biogenesis protein CcmH [Thermoleophilaceae bacterium]
MRRVLAALLLLALLVPTAASAAAGCPKTSLADIENEVMCPVCGVPLGLATEAPQAQRERAFIQREVESCKSKRQIKNELVAQFGDRVLALPPDKGFNLAVYLVPAAIVLAGAAAVTAVALRRRRTPPAASNGSAPTPALGGEDAARLEDDLQRYDL